MVPIGRPFDLRRGSFHLSASAGDRANSLELRFVLGCPCGETIEGDTEDELVMAAFAHLRERHPERADEYEREHILFMTRRLVR
jgi:predicted small metal-binding protein